MFKRLQGLIVGLLIGTLLTGSFVFATPIQEAISVVYDNYKIFIDGADKSATPEDSKPFVYNGRTYVPLRYIAEAMGKKVSWDGETNSIYINDLGNLREDIYFCKIPNLGVVDDTISFDKDNLRVVFNGRFGGYASALGDTLEYGNCKKNRSISYAINGLADKVYCTFNGKDAVNESSAKIAFYDADSNKMLYETGYITNATDPVKIEFGAKGVLTLRVEITGQSTEFSDSKFYLEDFRYSLR